MKNNKKALRNRIYAGFYGLLRRLPLWVLYGVAELVYGLVYHLLKYRRDEVQGHLASCFPNKTEAELKTIEKQFYHHLANVAVETIKAGTMSEADLRQRVTVRNPEVLQAYFEQGKSALLLAAHYGNWEWLLLGSCVHLQVPIDAVYKPLHNQMVDDWMLAIRSRFGAQPIPVKSAIMDIMQRRKSVRAFAMVVDQSPIKEEEKYWAKFLGQDTPFPVGPQKIAQMTQYPVFFVGMKRLKRGHYEVFFELLGEPPHQREPGYPLMVNYAQRLEQMIIEDPAYWLWSYRKWKYKKPLYG